MKTSLRNFLAGWYRVTPHCSTGIAPCELLMKRSLRRTKLDLIQPTSQSLDKHKKKSEKQHDLNKFNKGDKVWARNYRKGQKWVQGVILDKIGRAMYHVKVDKGTWRRHAHQLRQDRSHYKDFDIPSFTSETPTIWCLTNPVLDDIPCAIENLQRDTYIRGLNLRKEKCSVHYDIDYNT